MVAAGCGRAIARVPAPGSMEVSDEKDRGDHQAVQARRREGGADRDRRDRHDRDRGSWVRPPEGPHRALSGIGVHRRFPAQGQDRGRRRRSPGGQGHVDHRGRGQDGLDRRRQGLRVAHRRGDPDPHRRDGRVGRLTRGIDLAALLTTSGAAAKRHHSSLRRHGFAAPAAALTNLHALTPTPRDCELLAPVFPRLLAELTASPDPDMALNNLERYAAAVDRGVLFRTLAEHPGAAALLARVGGASQFLADVLRRRPSTLAWLLEPRTMRVWLAEDLADDLAMSLAPFGTREARANALRRFKYRQLLRIGARDLLGDADLAVTTEELSRLADACLGQAHADALADARARFGAPLDAGGRETGLAVVGMG